MDFEKRKRFCIDVNITELEVLSVKTMPCVIF